MTARTILFTGFPGFIGARLIPLLLERDPEAVLVALVEPRMADRARTAAAALPGGDRIEVLPGDITLPRLGLDEGTYRALAARTVLVHHLAAIYDLAVPMAVAERVNVVGTQNVVDFCRACPDLERLAYVSTAYVAGMRTGTVLEQDLAAGQDFKNHYESTKFAAEVLVRAAATEIPTTILRPAIVVGDSRTGETQKFDGPYYILRTISREIAMHGPVLRPGAMRAPFNVVPVDFVVDAIAVASTDPESIGDTLHLVDPDPLQASVMFDLMLDAYAGRKAVGHVPWSSVDLSLRSKTVRRIFGGTPRESLVYLNHDARYDTTRATEILAPNGLRCPPFSEYVGPMVDFFKQHEHDAAFASKP